MNDFAASKLKCNFKDFIAVYENAFTKKECENTIKLFELYDKCNYTYSRKDEYLNMKDDVSININPSIELDWNLQFIESFHDRFYNYLYPIYNRQFPILQKLKKHQSKYIKIQKTCPTQGYHVWHCEHNGSFECDKRILSWILYLNDVNEGGETEFLYQSLRIKPEEGTFILFPAYFTHTHRGNPPLNECKYIATGWIEFLYTEENQGINNFLNITEKTSNKINYQ